ncbi:hypothetical protein Pla110_02300 [Polystyrenella longa]|uniref:Uncharacterized protein n=1 Tax=Polystyrenella longa TaxID=2528007 RepID=A0A518CH21_9PLAN|nr:hypothetical protein [Polystyrenella longa]QDU78526.1 hypothetical protein Pla110_02300 [Polystyrenella longa]
MNRVTRMHQLKWLKGIVAFSCMVSIAAAFQPPTAGLQGILPDMSPYDVSLDEFEIIPAKQENWREWSDATAIMVADLYENPELDAAGQTELLDKLDERLAFMSSALKNPSYRALHGEFAVLYGRVSRRADLARAALETLTLDPASITQQQREDAMAGLQNSVSALTRDMKSRGTRGTGWLAYFKIDPLTGLTVDSENAAEALNASKAVFDQRDSLDDELKSFVTKPVFDNVAAEINNTLSVWNAPPPEDYDVQALRDELAAVVVAVEGYEESNEAEYAAAVRQYADSFGETALDGGELVRAALQKHYLNSNVVFEASEQFLSKMASNSQTRSRPISETVGNARVSGTATTNYNTSVNLRPNPNIAEMELQLSGTVRTNTVSVVPDARIGMGGNHTFSASQRLTFNGDKLSLYSEPSFNVNVNNYTTSINTKADGTLFAGTGRRRAQEAIAARRGQTDSMARNKITNEVLPEFRSEVSQQVSKINNSLQESLVSKLKDKGLYPSKQSTSSTDSVLTLASTLLKDSKLAGDQPNVSATLSSGAAVHIHESAVNTILDELNFAGRTMTETEVKTELEEHLSEWLGKDFQFPVEDVNAEGEPVEEGSEDADEETVFIFDAEDPIRVQFRNNEAHFIVRAGFQREGKDDLETQIITVPLSFTMKDSQTVLIEADTPSVRSEGGANVAQSNAIKKRIMSAFPPRERSRQVEIERDGRSPIRLNIQEINALNGWMTIKVL